MRELCCVIDHCQALDPTGIFVAAIVHIDNARMPGGNNKHFMHRLFLYVRNATRAQLAADNLPTTWTGSSTGSGPTTTRYPEESRA